MSFVLFIALIGAATGNFCHAQEIDVMKNLASSGDTTISSQSSSAPIPTSISVRNRTSAANQTTSRHDPFLQQNKNGNELNSYSSPDMFPLPSSGRLQSSETADKTGNRVEIPENKRMERQNPFSSDQVHSISTEQFDSNRFELSLAVQQQPNEAALGARPKANAHAGYGIPPLELANPADSSFGIIDESVIHVAAVMPRTQETSENAAPHLEALKIDLTPSYSKHLKYVETFGAVVVQADFPLTEIKSILSEIERLQRDLTLYMGVPQPKEKIELCLFNDEKSYQKFLKDRFPKAPKDRRALYIKLNNEPGTLLVQRTKEFDIDLRHEMTHAIIHASIPVVPIWLDEGLAKYFEVPVEDRSEKNPYIKTIRWNVRFGAVPSLRRLERLEFIDEMGSREYRDSWAWVHFMVHHSPDTHRLLAGYLQLIHRVQMEAIQNGKPIQDSIKLPALGPYLNDVVERPREKYREHFQTWGAPQSDD